MCPQRLLRIKLLTATKQRYLRVLQKPKKGGLVLGENSGERELSSPCGGRKATRSGWKTIPYKPSSLAIRKKLKARTTNIERAKPFVTFRQLLGRSSSPVHARSYCQIQRRSSDPSGQLFDQAMHAQISDRSNHFCGVEHKATYLMF